MAGALIKPLIKHAFKQGTEEVLQQGAKRTLKQGAGEVLQQGAEQVVKQVPSTPLAVNLADELAEDFRWNNTPEPMRLVYQKMSDAGDGKNITNEFRLWSAGNQDASTALQNRFSSWNINQKNLQAVDGKRTIQAAAEGRVLEAPDEPMVPTVSDDLNYLKPDVDYSAQEAEALKIRKSALKLKPGSEDAASRLSTIGAANPDQIKLWLKKAEQKWKAGIPFEEGDALTDEMGEFLGSSIEGMTFQELHHELMKAVYSTYLDTAYKLIEKGDGNIRDIINLNQMADSFGFGMGDYGVAPYPKLSHSWSHNELIAEGVQKTGDELKDQLQNIRDLPNMQSLAQDFKRSLEELAVPMRRKMDLGNRAYKQLPEVDRIKVHQLSSAKNNLKKDLKELMINEYQQAGIPIPAGDGQKLFKAFKKSGGKPSETAVELNKAIDVTRKEQKELAARMKKAIGPIVEKDVELDIEEMEQLIDQQFEGITDADTMTREFALKRGSIREAGAKAEQKAAAEAYDEPAVAPKTIEEARANMAAIKAGTLHYPGQKRGTN